MSMSDEEPRLVRPGEIFDMDDLERGRLRLPEPPTPRPRPANGGDETWARVADMPFWPRVMFLLKRMLVK